MFKSVARSALLVGVALAAACDDSSSLKAGDVEEMGADGGHRRTDGRFSPVDAGGVLLTDAPPEATFGDLTTDASPSPDAAQEAGATGGPSADVGRDGSDVGAGSVRSDGWLRAPDAATPPCSADGPVLVEDQGPLEANSRVDDLFLGACQEHHHRVRAPQGARLEISVVTTPAMGPAELAASYPDAESWNDALATSAPGEGHTLLVEVPRAGEIVVRVRARDPKRAGYYNLALTCHGGCDAETTRHPIVLVHGWTGWSEVVAYTYFYGVTAHLEGLGYPVFVASLDPYNSVEVRSTQLAGQIDTFMADGHATRVNIIAHSQGGLDSRRVISTLGYGDRVATLTTISTPHRGTPLTDIALENLPGPAMEVLASLLEWLGATTVESQSDAIASFESLSERHVQNNFNAANPDDPRVEYVSYAGRTCPLGITCDDICDIEIRWAYYILLAAAGENDGIVPVESAIWGDYRGEIPADHFDEIGQLLGITNPSFDHLAFYLGVARDLVARGH